MIASKKLLRAAVIILTMVILILSHETGHWLAAKAFGLETPVFSIGFGPREASLVLGNFWGTEFRFSPILLGGYVEIPALDFTAETPPLALGPRTIIELSGVAANFLGAVSIFTWLFHTRGRVIGSGKKPSLAKAFTTAVKASVETSTAILQAVWASICPFAGKSNTSASGPIGAFKEGSRSLSKGLVDFAIFVSNVELGLATLNTLPLPPLDGGALLMAYAQYFFDLTPEQVDLISIGIMLTVVGLALSTWAIRRLRRAG